MRANLTLALVLALSLSTVRSMPGAVCGDVSPTFPDVGSAFELDPNHADLRRRADMRLPTLLGDVCRS